MGCLISRLAAEGNPDELPVGGKSYYQPEATDAAISQILRCLALKRHFYLHREVLLFLRGHRLYG